jgi:hypothetical protein
VNSWFRRGNVSCSLKITYRIHKLVNVDHEFRIFKLLSAFQSDDRYY